VGGEWYAFMVALENVLKRNNFYPYPGIPEKEN